MKSLTAALLFCVISFSSASAQQAPTKPKELDLLSQYVGHWTSDVTNKPAVWDEKGTKFRCLNQAEFILDGWFLQHIEVNHVVGDPDKVTKSLFLWSYDPKSAKYVAWAFQSTGNCASSSGKWDSAKITFTISGNEPLPNITDKMTEHFVDAATIKGNLTFVENGGKVLMDMEWTRKRQAGVAGQPTREQWDKIGNPIQPLPDEIKKLQPFIGEWDAEFINAPSVTSPQGRTSKAKSTGKWVLDGRFLLGTTEFENFRSIWLMGFDSNKNQYRMVRFTNGGQTDETVGQWDNESNSFVMKPVNERPGITRTAKYHIVGNDAIESHILSKDQDGKVQMDLTIKSSRRK